MDSDLNVSVTLGDTYIFIGDICLDQSSIQARFHVVQFLIVLENYTGTSISVHYFEPSIQKELFNLPWKKQCEDAKNFTHLGKTAHYTAQNNPYAMIPAYHSMP